MKSIVITGSTRGIGYGLAHEFLKRGCQVTVNGRSATSVSNAIESLSQSHDANLIAGEAGDVSNPEDHQKLWETAVSTFGKADIWINNAGLGHEMQAAWDLPAVTMEAVVETNILGTMYGSRVAIQGMLSQEHGQIYNMEGFGARGNTRVGMSAYGTSKAAIRYYSNALIEEVKETAVQVGILSPGMIITDMILDQYQDKPEELEKYKRIFNIVADRVENVTPWLVNKMLTNQKNGAHFVYAPPTKLAWRFVSSPFKKRDVFTSKN